MDYKSEECFPVRLKPLGRMIVVKTMCKPEQVNGILVNSKDTTFNESLVKAEIIAVAPDCQKLKVGDTVYFTTLAAASQIERYMTETLISEGIIPEQQIYTLHEDNVPVMYDALPKDYDWSRKEPNVIAALTPEELRRKNAELKIKAQEAIESMNNRGRIQLAGARPGL